MTTNKTVPSTNEVVVASGLYDNTHPAKKRYIIAKPNTLSSLTILRATTNLETAIENCESTVEIIVPFKPSKGIKRKFKNTTTMAPTALVLKKYFVFLLTRKLTPTIEDKKLKGGDKSKNGNKSIAS